MNVRNTIKGIEVNSPVNFKGLKLSVKVDPVSMDKIISFDGDITWGDGDLTQAEDAYLFLKSIIDSGTTGGNGVAEAVDIVVEAEEFGRKIVILDALINLWDSTLDEESRQITAPIFQRGGQNWLADNTSGVSFEYLKSQNEITENDIILCPYVIEKQNQTIEKVTALLTSLVLVTQIRQQVSDIQTIAADLPSLSPWVAILKIAVKVAYITILLKTLFDTVLRLINLLVQPVKYVAGMTVKRHFEILFNHVGFKFESSIFDGDEQYLTIFPEKYYNPINKDYDDIAGWIKPNKSKQNGFFKGFGFQFCQIFKDYYNAKFIVDQENNIVRFERRDFVKTIGAFDIPNVWEKQTLNRSEFYGNHLFSFETDLNDRHTIQGYSGVSSSVNIRLSNIADPQKSLTDKGKSIAIPFALFKLKTELSGVE
jgi:hypothetical protein